MNSPAASLSVAIVGAGPAGFYTAQALTELAPRAQIDLIDRLPTPFGLIRYGVAPDHQETKKIQELFESIALSPQVGFIGNVEIGRDIALAELRELYDAVVLAHGVPQDASLGIPGDTLPGVYGAASFVGWYNGHPDLAGLQPRLGAPGAVVVGNGNVAIDIARVLSKSRAELERSDMAPYALEHIARSAPGEVYVMGRRGPVQAKFTTVELAELGTLEQAVALAEPADIPDRPGEDLSPRDRRVKAKNLECLQAYAHADPHSKPKRIHLHFYAKPLEILGADRVEGIRFERMESGADGVPAGTGRTFDLACSTVIAAIGYRACALEGLALAPEGNRLHHDDGRLCRGLYVAGWLRRGPSGKIGTNRADGEAVAQRICLEIPPSGRAGRAGLLDKIQGRGLRTVDFEGWKRIEAAECVAATPEAVRRKISSVDEMLAIAHSCLFT
ncbi:hypothetical protein CSC67_15010 [Pusillimonas caeni]|uniref:FAD-dependent oxidoreductase n=1 Tax=Pusillimonas caeni TaxID=1348472 RepID=UPI000E5A0840|nr:FAD-dependent oxidoreductase [Pusillimonas caeni]TFL13201.1 hypothetical protein CSC67_15010 [Pusillimonas caeni]